ncbi:MAG: hypothetical protein ACI8W8_000762 [Rhodothermales bacterium]|jgi:hypothetical protein
MNKIAWTPMPYSSHFFLSCLLAVAACAQPALEPFLETHCFECHDDDVAKGDLDLLSLKLNPRDPANFAIWERVFDRVLEGEMPPKKKARPKEAEKTDFLAALQVPLIAADEQRATEAGRVNMRRLTRREYEFTIHDLLGTDMPVQEYLPEDPTTHGFETVASGQQVSHFLLGSYLDVADKLLHDAFKRAFKGDAAYSRTYLPKALTKRGSGNYRGPELRSGRIISWPANVQFYGRMMPTRVPDAGWYRVTLKDVQAINPKNGVIWGTLKSGVLASNAPMTYPIGLIEATAQKQDLVYTGWIREGDALELKPNDATLTRFKNPGGGGNVTYGADHAKAGVSGIALSKITVERVYPNATQRELGQNLIQTLDLTKEQYMNAAPKEQEKIMNRAISRFAERAFRRPVTKAQLQPYLDLARAAAAEKKGQALHIAYRAILCSPRFLTLIEKPGKLDDYAIASRLSYALWNSMPDAKLLALADAGKLRDPAIIRKQADRMLNDPKAKRFVTAFADQWLDLRNIDSTNPDRRMFRTWDEVVQRSMLAETRDFLGELIDKNLQVSNLIDSDFMMINERLARHYGLKAKLKPGQGIQRVSVNKSERGGLVTQGAVLKVTANGTTTSPVVRGVWVSERLLGMHVPPPPPNVPAVEPDIRGAISIRDQLNKHRDDPSCASCHAKVDPAGFALENFDPVGNWRTKYGKAKIDPSGQTPSGERFKDLAGWRAIYAAKPEILARGFAKYFVTYATGAPPGFSDRKALDRIVAVAGEAGYGIRDIIHATVTSELFLTK